MTKKTATREGVVPQGDAVPKVLTPKLVRFVDEYLVDLNATQAAIRAGFSAKTAKQAGYRALTNVDVQSAVEAKRKELAAAVGVTRERVLQEMAKLAFSDLRQLYNEDGTLKHPHEWPEGAAGSVAGMDFETVRVRHEDGSEVVERTEVAKVKLWDKGKQLENLLKHLGMDQDAPRPADAAIDRAQLDALAAKVARFLPEAA